MRQIPVWDLATRLFHWLLVLVVVTCFFTGEDEGLEFAVHAYAGFVVLMLLLFRLGWGIIGSRHSRFGDFVYGWPTIRRFTLSFLRLKPEQYVGHNPLGGWMVILMLAVLTATTVTGILMLTGGGRTAEEIHETLGNLMEILVLVHIAGVVVDRVLTGDRIVLAMITGRKELAADAAAREVPLAAAGKAMVLALVVVIATGWLFYRIDYPSRISSYAAAEGARHHRADRD